MAAGMASVATAARTTSATTAGMASVATAAWATSATTAGMASVATAVRTTSATTAGALARASLPICTKPSHPSRVAEGCAKEADALRKEFEAIGVRVHRAEPAFPERPGYGAAGTPCVVKTNHLFVRLVDDILHYYDVTVSPEPTSKAVYREIMSKLVSEHQHTDLGGRLTAFDCWNSMFTADELPFDTKEFDVTISGDERKERMYKVGIKHVTPISLLQLRMLLAGYPTDIPPQALQILDIVLCDFVFNQRNDTEYVVVGRSFFSQEPGCTKDLRLGIEGWKGLYQSIRPTQSGLSLVVGQISLNI